MRRLTLSRLEQFDPVSVVFALHVTGLLLTSSVARPLPVAFLTIVMVTARIVLGLLARQIVARHRWQLVRSVVTLSLIGGVIVADGGSESPFFFWLLLLLAWQAVTASWADFRASVAVAAVVYVTAVLVAGDVTATSVARFGLFVVFALVMTSGRLALGAYESRIRRLQYIMTAVLSVTGVGVVVYDSDRHTPLFANEAATAMGFASHPGMARLVPDDAATQVKIDTLASRVEDAGWLHYQPRLFRPVGAPSRALRIGIHALKFNDADPVIIVYGEEAGDDPAAGLGGPPPS